LYNKLHTHPPNGISMLLMTFYHVSMFPIGLQKHMWKNPLQENIIWYWR